jgi:hypothetical protein
MDIKQNQIKATLSTPRSIEYISNLLRNFQFKHRTALAIHLCDHFSFHDTSGKPQQSGCLKALRKLEEAGHFTLPNALRKPKGKSPRRLFEPVPPAKNVPKIVDEIKNLELFLVSTEEHMRIWNELMINEHPLGAGPLVGRQLRYLIGSEHGWLGGIGFAAAALQLADRDKWIGWDAEHRNKHLHLVINMNRLLIRPSLYCQNLASRVLSMSLKQMQIDFKKRFGYCPLLVESFVDTSHSGACYRAANWIKIGETKGRGRQDRYNQKELSIKSIYVYSFSDDFRIKMGLSSNAGQGALTPIDGLEGATWAEYEFGGADLGDKRLNERLIKIAAAKAQAPDRAFSGVAKGDWPAVKAYYRLIDQPEESAVTPANILSPHRERTIRRMKGQKTILCIQDGSDLNFNDLNYCKGLGKIGTNQTGANSYGLHLHSTFAVATNGLPLGVLRADCNPRQEKSSEDMRPSYAIPIEEKKTFCWIEHYRDLVEIASDLPNTRIINICDREADFFEMFEEQRDNPSVHLLIRAQQERNIAEDPFKLFAAARQAPTLSSIRVHINRQSARTKKIKQDPRPNRPERITDLTVRATRVQLKPAARHFKDKKPIEVWIIHALEENPPEGAEPIEWFLLTTIEITCAEDAEECLRWYCLRWRIEDWHRVLKSGCRIEDLAHESVERLQRAISINLVIAWRIMLMTLLGREQPQLPAEILFTDIELKTLTAYAKKKKLAPPIQLNEAVLLVAKIGGYLGRKNDPPPGHQILWKGYTEFQFMCLGYALWQDEDCTDTS